jgi:hypothetical protein
MGVILWYQVEFPEQRLKLSSDVNSGQYLVDAEISVTYAIGEPGRFQIHAVDLPLPVHRALTAALGSATGPGSGIKIVIRLGCLEDPVGREAVLTGRVDSIQSSTRFPPLGMLLTGYEEASFRLLTTVDVNKEGTDPALARISRENASPADVARYVAGQAGVKLAGEATPDNPALPSVVAEAQNAFNLLDKIATRFGAEVLAQEGVVQFGIAVKYPSESGLPVPPNPSAVLALVTGEDSLIAIKTMDSARLAEFKPIQLNPTSRQRVVTDLPEQADVSAFDFTVLGVPSLRAGQLVAASVEGYQNPFKGFRVLHVTHSFSPKTGYTCTGRAVVFKDEGNRRRSELARRGSPLAIADRIAARIEDGRTISPSVDVGKIQTVKSAQRVATLGYGQESSPAVASPSVDAEISRGQAILLDKPIASPFAWHNVGLSVPVYQGMRALLSQVRDSRDDAVVTGFLWANEAKMERPKAQDGDWWLCLPTELTVGTAPTPTGKGVNDLTAADGRRVVEAIGLKIAVGAERCSSVGDRPKEGDAEVLLIVHASGTTIQIDAEGNATVDGGAHKVVLKSSGVTLTVGDGKVAIS